MNPQRRAGIKMLKELPAGSVCAEIGVFKGNFSKIILSIANPASLTLIDPWQWREQWFVKHTAEEVAAIEGGKSTSEGDEMYRRVKATFASDPRVHIWRLTSLEAARKMPDASLDWAFIDGDHRYAPVLDDLAAWWPKIKPGGYLCGDDYVIGPQHGDKHSLANGVKFAVEEFVEAEKLELKTLPWGEGDKRGHFMIRKPKPSFLSRIFGHRAMRPFGRTKDAVT